MKSKPWFWITRSPFQTVGTVIWKKAPFFWPVIVVSASASVGSQHGRHQQAAEFRAKVHAHFLLELPDGASESTIIRAHRRRFKR